MSGSVVINQNGSLNWPLAWVDLGSVPLAYLGIHWSCGQFILDRGASVALNHSSWDAAVVSDSISHFWVFARFQIENLPFTKSQKGFIGNSQGLFSYLRSHLSSISAFFGSMRHVSGNEVRNYAHQQETDSRYRQPFVKFQLPIFVVLILFLLFFLLGLKLIHLALQDDGIIVPVLKFGGAFIVWGFAHLTGYLLLLQLIE